jgi:hypothetical protein
MEQQVENFRLVSVAKRSDSPQRRKERKGFTLGLLCALCASAVDFVLSQQELDYRLQPEREEDKGQEAGADEGEQGKQSQGRQ